jgi:hypothetical protein
MAGQSDDLAIRQVGRALDLAFEIESCHEPRRG